MRLLRSYGVLLILLISVGVGFGQSGRRIKTTPTPEVVVAADDPSQYSESKPNPSRVDRMGERFPGIGVGAGTKKVSEPAKPATVEASDPKPDGDILRVETNLVTIPVSVFDRNGLYVPNLRQDDFKIFEDGVEQNIEYFGTADKPFTVALLIDTSPSTQYKIDEIHAAAAAFVDRLGPNDKVVVIEFHDSVKIQCKATSDRDQILKGIYKAKFGNGTSLYNAVDTALRKELGEIQGRKAVVLFTDGVDTTSRKNSYDSTLNYAEESDSLIFPIYYNTYFQNQQNRSIGFPNIFGGSISAPGTTAAEYALGRKYLEDLADATGGRVFRPESTPGGLTRAFQGIAEELRRQYNIGYIPANEGKTGQRKQIKVRVDRPNLVLRARDSYVVGASRAIASPSPEK